MTRTIEDRAAELLNPVLAECVRQRTAAGVAKYGQRLDDNHQPLQGRIIHLIQELLDGVQYGLWAGEGDVAAACASEARYLQRRYGLTAAEIMEGGKQ